MSRVSCFVWRLTILGLLILLNSESQSQAVSPRPEDDVDPGVLQCLIDTYHLFGYSVAGGADLDQDGVSDFMVGVPSYDFGQCQKGKVYIYSGKDGSLMQVTGGPDSLSLFGYSLDFLGDVNNDGVADLLIGAPGFGNYTGRVYIFSGSNFSILHTFTGESTGDKYGFSVSDAGNTGGDGKDDIIVGAPGAQSGRGRIYLYCSPNWYLCFPDSGEAAGDSLGYSVSGAGDVNNDGHDDVIAGAPYFDGVLGPNNGRTYVLSGSNGSLLCWDYGPEANAHFGWSVSDLGDIDNDGKVEFVVGDPGYSSNTGQVQISQNDGIDLGNVCDLVHYITGPAPGERFGHAVASAGHIDYDSKPDIIVGAPAANSNTGKAYVYLANKWFLKWQLNGSHASGRFGFAVASAGDVNGDGYDDVIVGAPRVSSGAGEAYVYSGSDSFLIYERDPSLPTLTILRPNSQDALNGWWASTVSWDTSRAYLAPIIKMRFYDGSNWSDLGMILNTGSYCWCVPNITTSSHCRIILSTLTEYAADTSEEFTITHTQSPIHMLCSCLLQREHPLAVDGVVTKASTEIGSDGATGDQGVVSDFKNYPNPFNPATTISFTALQPGHVRLNVCNIAGQNVRTLVDEYRTQGSYYVVWNGRDDHGSSVASGVYFYQLRIGNTMETRKMLLFK